nr:hypothetical protein [uncultured Blautia sp.]
MISILGSTVDPNTFLLVFVILLVMAYFVYKEWPEFNERMSKQARKEQKMVDAEKIDSDWKEGVERSIGEIKKRQQRDYDRLNDLADEAKKQREAINDSLKERRLLMRGVMACLDGLEQQGCNHTVPSTKNEINEYLNEQAHSNGR